MTLPVAVTPFVRQLADPHGAMTIINKKYHTPTSSRVIFFLFEKNDAAIPLKRSAVLLLRRLPHFWLTSTSSGFLEEQLFVTSPVTDLPFVPKASPWGNDDN